MHKNHTGWLFLIGVVLLAGAVLIATFVIQALSGLIRNLAPDGVVILEILADLLAVGGSWALGGAVLAALFRFLTTGDLRWTAALIGGVATALVLTLGNRVVSEYLVRYGASSLAGAAGSIIVGLLWIYAIAQIALVGAEFTRIVQLSWRSSGPDDE